MLYPNTSQVRSICIFGGAESGNVPGLIDDARYLGREIARSGLRLVYGGGTSGIMGAVAEAAIACSGEVVAIAPGFLIERMQQPKSITQVIAVPDMHMRKRLMFDYADAFVALPGGIGTIDEMAEVMTWRKLRQHTKPVVIANFDGFWSPWLLLLDHMQQQGFVSRETTTCMLVAEAAGDILPLVSGDCSETEAPHLRSLIDSGALGFSDSPNVAVANPAGGHHARA